DYHGLAAYFAGVRVAGDAVTVSGQAVARHPRTGEVVPAHPLGGPRPARPETGDRREELARWLTAPGNPWFARNLANRVWAHFLARGPVEPLADVRETTPPSNPELLDALATHLIESKHDLKALIRTITASQAYQRSTSPNPTNERDALNFSRAPLRRLP